jgi:adenine-specific DNA-methyltransferase
MAKFEMVEQLREILRSEASFDKYWRKGALLRNRVVDDLREYDDKLIAALLSNDYIRGAYTKQIAGEYVFQLEQLIGAFQYRDYWENSYTKYANKIGLTANGKFIDESTDVVLDYPFKDTILKGGMVDENLKDEEPFLNEVLAKTEIDQLFAPKIFKNSRIVGESNAVEVDNPDNLVIKGNNLIVLHGLRKKYAGRVKQIFLDPPYNTGKDFGYNDRFNHATWLTFMKNRLEVAKDFLTNDGTLWMTIDSNESHYLKVLADSIFGRENFVDEIIWQRAFSPINLKKTISRSHDTILVYAKNFDENFELNRLPRDSATNERYKNIDNDPRGPWTSGDLSVGPAVEANIYPIITPSGRSVLPPAGYSWRLSQERLKEYTKENRIWFGEDGNNTPRMKRFLSDVKDGVVSTSLWKHEEVGHNQEAKKELKALFPENPFGTPKPERLMQRILTLGSNKGDLVMDFFMGSATTPAVAMKMGRRFISIEQMDYIKTVSVERLKKVIEGEQGGISKDVNWQGGGSFVYAELMEKNQGYIGDIAKASTPAELEVVYNRMKDVADFDFRADLDKFLEEKDEAKLTFEERKQLLVKILDKNQLYYNYADIDDENVRDLLSDEDYNFNKAFYEGGEA